MSLRSDREDYSTQIDRIAEARSALEVALRDLAAEAITAAKACRSKRGAPDLPTLYGLMSAVRRAEEDVDHAVLDLATARGEDA